jgi:diguanylate cyclase (GGDEF)-like protein
MTALGALSWAVPVVMLPLCTAGARNGGVVPGQLVVLGMALLFPILLTRLVLAAVRDPERRLATLSLAVAFLLWVAAAIQVSLAPAGHPAAQFPAPGEWLGLSAVAALAVHLFMDVARRVRSSVADWLEAIVASGGAVCLVALLVVTPLADEFARQGVPLLVALTYPVTDALLLAVVVAQVFLRRRALSAGTAILAGGLVVLTAADVAGSAVNLAKGAYTYGVVVDLAWSLAFILISESACRPRVEPRPSREGSVEGGRATVGTAGVALVVLAIQPVGTARPYVVISAVVTFLAAGARLVIALREAREAAEAYRLSRTDELTGLANRRAIVTDLATRLTGEEPLSVVLLNIDGFKEVNDSLGHSSGDGLLKIIARRLRHAFSDDVMVARLGGDEFALVVPGTDPEMLTELAEDMRRLVRRPISLDGLEISVEASVGIAVRTDEIATKGDLLRCADVAMHQAKGGPVSSLIYDPSQDEFSRSRLALAEDLRRGLEKGEIIVWYQPQVKTDSGEVCSVEALVRWRHPVQGLMPPFAFLPVARRAGLMPRLTEVVLRAAIRDLAEWRSNGLDVRVAINVAPPELLGGTVLPELGAVLAREGVPADRLVVEVTEDSFLADPDHARRVIQELRLQGMQVSIDDYGTGFSSLAYLRDLPLQELKIDRSFVTNILTDERSWMIIDTTNQLAHGLGLRTVAEGVEDDEQRQALATIGIDVLQGYHFARPMPAPDFVQWMHDRPGVRVHAGSA